MRLSLLAGGAVAALALLSAPASAATWVTVELEIEVAASADDTWAAVGDYCSIEVWLGMGCVLTAGDGGLGSVRLLNDQIEEVLVGQGLRSYTYVQTVGSMAAAGYHGTLSVEPLTDETSRIVYTLIWDEEALDPDRRESTHTNFTNAFQGAVEAMKELVEQ